MSLKLTTPCDYMDECPYDAEYMHDCEYWCGAHEREDYHVDEDEGDEYDE